MRKILLLFVFAISQHISIMAQQEELVIDCQNPGWLSSMIQYGNQKTLKKIIVTGYINTDDVKFLKDLVTKHSLQHIDLENVRIVGVVDDSFTSGLFSFRSEIDNPDYYLPFLSLPKYVKNSKEALGSAQIDTLIVGSEEMPNLSFESQYGCYVKHIYIREGVKIVGGFSSSVLESVHFPESLEKIEDFAFGDNPVKEVNFPNNLKEIGEYAFRHCAELKMDSLILPNSLQSLYFNSFPMSRVKYIRIPQSVNYIINERYTKAALSGDYDNTNLINSSYAIDICVEWKEPIKVDYYEGGYSMGYSYLASSTLHVPFGTSKLYADKNHFKDVMQENVWAYASRIIEDPLDSIRINCKEINLLPNSFAQLHVSVYPQNAVTNIAWKSSNPDVAIIENDGQIKAKKCGTAMVIGWSIDAPEIIDSCLITVYQPVNKLTLSENEICINVGETRKLRTTIHPEDASDKTIVWKSNSESIASVNDGIVVGVSNGETYIYAISNYDSSIKDSCLVKVAQPVTGIKLNAKSVTLNYIGETDLLYATIMPENATNRNVRWQSTNESVCIVSGNGMIVATGYGTAVVIASTEEGGFMAVCTVTVEDADVIKEIKITDKAVNVYSPQGTFVKAVKTQNDINTLQPGIYIINHQKFIKR